MPLTSGDLVLKVISHDVFANAVSDSILPTSAFCLQVSRSLPLHALVMRSPLACMMLDPDSWPSCYGQMNGVN